MLPKLRPIHIAAHRLRELMAIIAAREFEDADWVDEDLADLTWVDEDLADLYTEVVVQVETVNIIPAIAMQRSYIILSSPRQTVMDSSPIQGVCGSS